MPQDKDKDKDKETPEVSGLKTAGPEGEITAGPYSYIFLQWLSHKILVIHDPFSLHCMLLLLLRLSDSSIA